MMWDTLEIRKKDICLQIDKSIRKNKEIKEYFIKVHKMVDCIDLRVRYMLEAYEAACVGKVIDLVKRGMKCWGLSFAWGSNMWSIKWQK